MQSLPDILHVDEELTRFLDETNRFKNGFVLAKAFEPKFDRERSRSEVSVFRSRDLAGDEIWSLASTHYEPVRGKPTLAGAAILCDQVVAVGLRTIADEPPVRHAVILGWPEGDEAKPQRKLLQQKLAAASKLVMRHDD